MWLDGSECLTLQCRMIYSWIWWWKRSSLQSHFLPTSIRVNIPKWILRIFWIINFLLKHSSHNWNKRLIVDGCEYEVEKCGKVQMSVNTTVVKSKFIPRDKEKEIARNNNSTDCDSLFDRWPAFLFVCFFTRRYTCRPLISFVFCRWSINHSVRFLCCLTSFVYLQWYQSSISRIRTASVLQFLYCSNRYLSTRHTVRLVLGLFLFWCCTLRIACTISLMIESFSSFHGYFFSLVRVESAALFRLSASFRLSVPYPFIRITILSGVFGVD